MHRGQSIPYASSSSSKHVFLNFIHFLTMQMCCSTGPDSHSSQQLYCRCSIFSSLKSSVSSFSVGFVSIFSIAFLHLSHSRQYVFLSLIHSSISFFAILVLQV